MRLPRQGIVDGPAPHIKRQELGRFRGKPGCLGDVQHDALRSPAEMIHKRVLPGPTGREPFRRASTLKGLSVNLEFVMSEHSVQGISNFRHRRHSDKVSDKVSDKERKINPNFNSKMSKLQPALSRAQPQETGDSPLGLVPCIGTDSARQ